MRGGIVRYGSIALATVCLATAEAVLAAEDCGRSWCGGDLLAALGLTVVLGVLMLNLRRLPVLKHNLWWRTLR